jgi:hypothetical protein
MESPIQTPEYVIQTFLQEFKPVAEKFIVLQETAATAEKSTKAFVWHPGVYVWIKDNRVIKVGRHLENSRKRALEHLNYGPDNTTLQSFKGWDNDRAVSLFEFDDPDQTILLLFNVVYRETDFHWPAAVEIFLEETLKPALRARRTG